MRYLSAHYVFPVSSPPLKNGIICVDDKGYIVDIIDTGGKLEELEKLEFYNGILVPGFVNAHCHLELSHLRNMISPNEGLSGFISSVGKIRKADNEKILVAAKAANEEMARNGIVAVGDISNGTGTLPIKRDSQLWYRTFVELFGLDNCRAEEILAAAKQVELEYHNAQMLASLVPHAIYSVSHALWISLSEWYASQTPDIISIHHQEHIEEMGVFLEGKGELIETLRKNGLLTDNNILFKDILSQMKHCFRKTSRCLLVHNTFSSKDDLLGYVSDPERFYFVVCPGSNLFIQKRLPDLQLFASPELCMNTCLGTDSLASNWSLSILDEMKIIQQSVPGIPLEMLLQWATLNGAKALGFDHVLGCFEKNKAPGINLITAIDFENMKLTAGSMVKVLAVNRK